jgi:hypothetical protein
VLGAEVVAEAGRRWVDLLKLNSSSFNNRLCGARRPGVRFNARKTQAPLVESVGSVLGRQRPPDSIR